MGNGFFFVIKFWFIYYCSISTFPKKNFISFLKKCLNFKKSICQQHSTTENQGWEWRACECHFFDKFQIFRKFLRLCLVLLMTASPKLLPLIYFPGYQPLLCSEALNTLKLTLTFMLVLTFVVSFGHSFLR